MPFECFACIEAFRYEPSPSALRGIEDMELKTGRICEVMIECPHCPAVLVLNFQIGRAEILKGDRPNTESRGLIWDMTFTEKAKEQVAELNAEGDNCIASDAVRAETLFRKALTLRRHDPMSWYNLGVCRFKDNDLEEAVKCYHHALQFDPTLLQAFNNLGTTLVFLGRLAEAEEIFDRGLAVDPNHPKFYLGKANLAGMKGDFSTARNLLNEALRKDPTYQMAKEGLRRLEQMSYEKRR